jgi:hypothetical protein
MYVYTLVCMYACMYVCECIYLLVGMLVCINVCPCVSIRMYVGVMYLCMRRLCGCPYCMYVCFNIWMRKSL